MTKLKLSIGPSSICPWDILLESLSDFIMTDIKSLRLISLTRLKLQKTLQKHSFLVYTAAAVVLKSLRKVSATYSLIIIPDSIRHIGHHFFCTLKWKQNILLHGPASERDQIHFPAFPRELLYHISRVNKWHFLALLSNHAFLLMGIMNTITEQQQEKILSGTTLRIMTILKHAVVKIPALHWLSHSHFTTVPSDGDYYYLTFTAKELAWWHT